jgi:hypothetical protein
MTSADIVLDQIIRQREAQMIAQQSNQRRAAVLAGYHLIVVVFITAFGLYEYDHRGRLMMIAGLAVTALLVVGAGGLCALSALARDPVLPGRLPSDLWDRMLDPAITPTVFASELIREDCRIIAQTDTTMTRMTTQLVWAACLDGAALFMTLWTGWQGIFGN